MEDNMRRSLKSAFPALMAALAGLCFLAPDGIAKTLTRGTPAEWKAACEANARSCISARKDSANSVYKVCSKGRCFVISCSETGDGGFCEKTDAPGPRPKQLQWSAAELL